MAADIRDQLVAFIVNNYLFGDASRIPADTESLLAAVDSAADPPAGSTVTARSAAEGTSPTSVLTRPSRRWSTPRDVAAPSSIIHSW